LFKHSRLLACEQECQANRGLFSEISEQEISRFEKHLAGVASFAFLLTGSAFITGFS
jgi:hypothetical protein